MTVAIGCDHAGFPLKEQTIRQLKKLGYLVHDWGTFSAKSVDYPDFAHPVAEQVSNGGATFGVVICGSGNGVAMAANKHPEVRAALCWNPVIARLARTHNDANVLAIPARFIGREMARRIVDAFFDSKFEGGRHQLRVQKIACQ
jgi:ribose 5-phosphate isomerase B